MITRITGTLIEKQPPFLVIDVNGLGYELQASMNTFYHLPEVGANVTLLTHFIVREDAHILFGFSDKHERALFQTLLKVNGIGPKSAIAILSSISPDDFVRCVEDKNALALQRLPGIGKKTAERLIVEMRDRLADWHFGNEAIAGLLNKDKEGALPIANRSAESDAISALVALGYKPQEASRAINQLTDSSLSSQEMIRQALKNMAA